MSSRIRRIRFAAAALLPIVVGSCSIVAPPACTTDIRYGLQVYVMDSVTGAWAASGAHLVAIDPAGAVDSSGTPGSFAADRPDLDPQPLLGNAEHAGVFRVVVRKAGYKDWVRTGVRVVDDECHVRTTQLMALLQR